MNELEWLKANRYYPEDIDESKLKNIFYFTLIWNLFEKECCNSDAKINSDPKEIAEKVYDRIETELLDQVFEYFQNRYVNEGKTNNLFENFKFGKNGNDGKVYKEFVKDKLTEDSEQKNKVQALLYIAFRLRNNLYHGIKDVSKLYGQNENFRQINVLMMHIIDVKCR